tara:strand:- start:164 stop:622 length:459 start_codon:yes stop_codon:yes gene_type:complete
MLLQDLYIHILSYTIAFFAGLFIITYLFNIPYLITNSQLVNEYYINNYLVNVPLDYIFVLLYIGLALLMAKLLHIDNLSYKIMIVTITTIILTGGWTYYFQSLPYDKNNFFSKWFHGIGYKSIIYDIIIVVTIYIFYIYMIDYKLSNNPKNT